MKSKEQIVKDVAKLNAPPEDYNLLEIRCFLTLKRLLIMFHNEQITKESATITKQEILKIYEEINEKITRLSIMLEGTYKKPVTEERLIETLNLAIEILTKIL